MPIGVPPSDLSIALARERIEQFSKENGHFSLSPHRYKSDDRVTSQDHYCFHGMQVKQVYALNSRTQHLKMDVAVMATVQLLAMLIEDNKKPTDFYVKQVMDKVLYTYEVKLVEKSKFPANVARDGEHLKAPILNPNDVAMQAGQDFNF